MAYTTVQNKAIADFRAITNVDKTTAARVLKANAWNVQQTVNSFYSDPSGASASPSRGGLGKLFDKYRDQPKTSPDAITIEGSTKYFEAIGVDLEGVDSFIVSEIVQCPSMGEITRDGFTDGWAELGAYDTIEKQKKFIQQRKATLGQPANRAILKNVYNHTFKLLITSAGQRAVEKGVCIAMWQVLFRAPSLDWRTPKFNWLELWTEFVTDNSIKMINSDVWKQTLKFAEESTKDDTLSWWSEESAWPALIDEFVEWHKERNPIPGDQDMEDMGY
ncbi:hypothetical protein FKW77_001282 [Venturia effusa]|uniref:Defective in cullin neddylation protein n=1 Tax=Venturia effusa TaxID=50376 RepID=A0A517LNE5_9PEZI|nr:hypothetical protein FKW77_001282 [Venturia effusa]